MDFKDCIKFATEQKTAYFATDDKGQPRVRPMGLWFVNEKGFYFQVGATKALYKQLQKNSKVEICFYAPGPGGELGNIEFLEDLSLKTKLLEDRPFLKNMGITGPEDSRLVIFRICNGEAYFWTMENSGRESEIKRIKF
jgi:uncharacterized pyridoxamine 5'-phosphate oxidase family protein